MAATIKEIKQLIDPNKNYRAGGVKSQLRLDELGFDPIGELVMLYRQLQNEDKLMCSLRDGTWRPLNDDGRVQRYSSMAHMALLSQLEKVASQLLRYGYGRVPETIIVDEKNHTPLVIKLIGNNDIEDGELV